MPRYGAPIVPPGGLLVTGCFPLRPDWRAFRPDGTGDWQLIHTLAGKGRFLHPRGEIVTQKGDLILFVPGTSQNYGSDLRTGRSGWSFIWTHFLPLPHWQPLLRWPQISRGIGYIRVTDQVLETKLTQSLKRMHSLATSHWREHEKLAMAALEEALLWCREARQTTRPGDLRIDRALAHISANPDRSISLAELARTASLSVSRFCHLFQQQIGTSPQRYMELQRLGAARRLLEFTTQTLGEIAYATGFESPFYFSTRFRKHFGLSPRAFRRMDKRTKTT